MPIWQRLLGVIVFWIVWFAIQPILRAGPRISRKVFYGSVLFAFGVVVAIMVIGARLR